MKNLRPRIIIPVIAVMFGAAGCAKLSNVNTDKPVIDAQISRAITADSLSHAYDDTLAMVEDTVTARLDNTICIKYDKLYHRNDSLFFLEYNLFGGEMYKYGKKMTGYTPPVKISADMIYSDGMTISELVADTIIMNRYYTGMQALQLTHQQYHNGIYAP
jgi:hypothetical protein